MAEKTIALLGQPNSGKSTLFNGLTGSRQHVGNWPGKTVERKDGFFSHNGITYKIVDLPGTYSLSANSDEEVVTRNYISSGEADLVCILADASQLNRSLFMLADYAGIHVPVVLLLNMMDVAEGQGKKINVTGLQKSLGIPVVPMVAADKKQYQPFFNLLENLDKRASFLNAAKLEQLCRKNIGDEYSAILELLLSVKVFISTPIQPIAFCIGFNSFGKSSNLVNSLFTSFNILLYSSYWYFRSSLNLSS